MIKLDQNLITFAGQAVCRTSASTVRKGAGNFLIGMDSVRIVHKSPVAEFKNYLKGFKLFGENFEPVSDNPESVFVEYFNYRKEICKPQAALQVGGLSIAARRARPKIIRANESPESYINSLIDFQGFIKNVSEYATKEQYYQIVDEIAEMMPAYVQSKYSHLRPEIVENSGRIFRWRSLMDVENKNLKGELVHTRFFDEEKKMQAMAEFSKFVEGLTGKKVLIGCPTRMTIGPDELGILNDPNSYKDVDYILFGHGKGASLITDTSNPETWRFSDSDESVWEYIENNVPKGKRILVGTCEKDGLELKDRRQLPQFYDKSGNFMYGIGAFVSTSFGTNSPAKIAESGKRHIIGHVCLNRESNAFRIEPFIHSYAGRVKTVFYDL